MSGVGRTSLLTGLVALALAAPAAASSMLAYDIPEMTTQADLVVRGTVGRAAGRWVGKRIVTEVTVRVDASLKGAAASEVTLYVPGGIADGIGMAVSGAPTFAVGEEVVVFLRQKSGAYDVIGLGQGKYSITKDAAGKKLATPEVKGLSLFRKTPAGGLVAATPPKAIALSELEAEISRALSR
jgi:hypothetical protein